VRCITNEFDTLIRDDNISNGVDSLLGVYDVCPPQDRGIRFHIEILVYLSFGRAILGGLGVD
jgi:hypothetical protein